MNGFISCAWDRNGIKSARISTFKRNVEKNRKEKKKHHREEEKNLFGNARRHRHRLCRFHICRRVFFFHVTVPYSSANLLCSFIVFRCNVMCVCFFCLFVRSMATCDLLVFPIASLLNNIPKQVDKLTYFQSVCIFAIGIYINVTLMEQRASPEEKTDKFQPQVCSTSLVFSLFGLRILFWSMHY